tara:strand:+ start:4590 stop:5048 length:459 start_codon:yes stop_codon:yes gene_type:complete
MRAYHIQLLLVLSGLMLIYLLFQLPTSVMEIEKVEEKVNQTTSISTAMDLIRGENPMEGIFMLREILEKDPKNKEALYNLGVLSIQTAQYQNAVNRFNQIIAIDSSDKRAYLQLGISHYYLENFNLSDSIFKNIKESNDSLLINELNIFLSN